MSFLETLLDGNNEKERKNKAACAAAIAITAILLVIAIIAFSICLIIDSTPAGPNDSAVDHKIENVEKKSFGGEESNAIKEGLLLTLNNAHRFTGTPSNLVNLQSWEERPKTPEKDAAGNPVNAYSVHYKDNSYATRETTIALNEMLKVFYNTKKNGDLIIETAFDSSAIDSQDAVFSAGTAIEFKYFTTDSGRYNETAVITNSGDFSWLYNNAHDYGFVVSSSNSNIFRYVGELFATAIKNSGLSFDAFCAKLKEATYENPVFLDAAKNYATYYCPIDNVLVPTDYAYDTDGDNVGGVYVTVDFTKPKNS